jgi:hypothetical protein
MEVHDLPFTHCDPFPTVEHIPSDDDDMSIFWSRFAANLVHLPVSSV